VAYRADVDALAAQCDALRRELDAAAVDEAELERLRAELRRKEKDLHALRAEIDPRLVARRRQRTLALALLLPALSGYAVWRLVRPDDPAAPSSSRAWFERARPHCNPLEVTDYLSRSVPPDDAQAPGYLATCWALGNKIDRAKQVLAGAGARRGAALQLLFNIAHPIADRGDDEAAGPIMSLMVDEWPQNYMAMYHAGMSDYARGDVTRAKDRLVRFLGMYDRGDSWTQNAKRALDAIAAGKSFADAFRGGRDPRLEN
jgi:hypothetical protein